MGCQVNAPDNAMVVGIGAALERHYAAADDTARDFAELRVLGDVLKFFEFVDTRDGLSDAADRALRIDSRLDEADSAVVLAALLLAAHRNDAEDTLRAARLLVTRYLARQEQRIARIAGGDE